MTRFYAILILLALHADGSFAQNAPVLPGAYGPFTNLTSKDFAESQSFRAEERIVGTYYFYWYDSYSKEHILDGDGTDALTTHPPTLEEFSYKSVRWHKQQLADMMAAGIDFLLPVFWGAPSEHPEKAHLHWSYAGLKPLVQAREELLREGQTPPRIGLFYDTSTLRHNAWREHVDLTTEFGKRWFYATIRDFFSLIPAKHWAMIDGKPIVFLYSAAFAKKHNQEAIDFTKQEFAKEFGGREPYIVREISWRVKADNAYAWGGALGLKNPGIASLGPGYDHSAVPGRKPLIVPRAQGKFYENNWLKMLQSPPQVVMVETWNEFHEGTDVCASQEYGRQFIELTRKYAALFRRGWKSSWPSGKDMGSNTVTATLGHEIRDSSRLKRLFAQPGKEYSTAPLWVWNDLLTEEQVIESLRDLARENVKQVFVHPRPGLMTPYLAHDWFRLWKAALKEAEQLDMNVWIYDENSYPSGFAGGWVPELMPESRGRGLWLRESKNAPKRDDSFLAAFGLGERGCENLTPRVRAGESLPEARYVVASVQRSGNSPWHGGRSYVDLLYPGVTEKFLEVTLEAYRREVGAEFGKRIPGVFTDEPQIHPAGGLPWTDDLPVVFEKKWGYSLLDRLPSLSHEVGDWQKVRHNYFQVLLDLFVGRWAKPYHDYCEKHGLEFTGHYWEHEWPRCLIVPDNMALYAWQQRPAIDTLMNQYQEDTHAQFGNARAVKELSSVANQLGLKRTLCEVYGAGGWDLRFEDMKRIGDWLSVLGVNTLDQHLSYITLRGARKRDHPQSFSYHEPWWEAYHVSATYFARLSAALSHGQQINSVLVLEPTTTAWMYNSEANKHPRLGELGNTFQKLIVDLEAAQIEYDLGCEDILARHGSVANGVLKVGQRQYGLLIIPPLTETLNARTMALVESYLDSGGAVLCAGEPPARIDGALSQRGPLAAKHSNWQNVDARVLPALLTARMKRDGFTIHRTAEDRGILFHHRRQLDDGQLLFLVNSSLESSSSGSVETTARGVEKWNPDTGQVTAYPFQTQNNAASFQFDLPPSGSLLVFLSKETRKPLAIGEGKTNTLVAVSPPEIRRLEPNVLVLDYVDITAGSETRTNLYFYQASQFAFQKNGLPRNPWDSAVQFRDELIAKKFPESSGFAATYRFRIEGTVPGNLSLILERPDLYAITCNGQSVLPTKGQWWLDKAFGRIDLTVTARAGENQITIKAAPFTIYHELEPAYLLGDFALRAVEHGFVIVADASLHLGRWNEQGHPFYGAGVACREQFDLAELNGQYLATLPAWYGSVAKVIVNGKTAGYIASRPWQCDVSRWLRPGLNSVEVVVIGTLKNTLGPHHGKPALGTAWPGMFQKAPNPGPPAGSEYSTVGYGLFGPFVLKQVIAEDQRQTAHAKPSAR
ncbi:MAG: DUF5010 domain-containing protein [Verrucomicrobia bacterium]|nr:DUF5010 domain-containing protein [Verrucomicrobiota bacterium]